MKQISILILLLIMTSCQTKKIKNNNMNTNKNFKDLIHKNAKLILTNKFYWDIDNPNGPFSINRVSNTFEEFSNWRNENLNKNILDYFPSIAENNLIFDRNSTDTNTIKQFLKVHYDLQASIFETLGSLLDSSAKQFGNEKELTEQYKNNILSEAANNISYTALKEHDDMIISVGFGQFVIEGTIDNEVKVLTEKAIFRQLLPIMLLHFQDNKYQVERKRDLEIMLNDLHKIK